jgi:hypothetical protein
MIDRRSGVPRQEESPTPSATGMTDDVIDEILADSFPASDPPPWTAGISKEVSPRRQKRRGESHES